MSWLILPEPVYRGAVLTTVAVAGYRSLRDVVVGLGPLDRDHGRERVGQVEPVPGVAAAGGSAPTGRSSARWPARAACSPRCGRARSSRARHVGAACRPRAPSAADRSACGWGSPTADGLGYSIDLGMPVPGSTAFALDPEIKREMRVGGPDGPAGGGAGGARPRPLSAAATAGAGVELSRALADPPEHARRARRSRRSAPEMRRVRGIIARLAVLRRVCAPTTTPRPGSRRSAPGHPVLARDGRRPRRRACRRSARSATAERWTATVADAFPGARISISQDGGWFEVGLEQPGVLRRMGAAELSDGTLRYLLLAAALLSPRPPSLLVLNEPETSLHRDLLPALGRLIRAAASRGQVVVVTHSAPLLAELGVRACRPEYPAGGKRRRR